MKYEITVAEDKVTMFEAFCVAKGFAGPQAFMQSWMDGQVDYAEKVAAENDRATLATKAASYDTAKPTLDKIAALDEENAKLVQDILDGKVTAADVTAVEKP